MKNQIYFHPLIYFFSMNKKSFFFSFPFFLKKNISVDDGKKQGKFIILVIFSGSPIVTARQADRDTDRVQPPVFDLT
jgi:hypothetical protein